jgi:hypothetical protein
LFGADKPVIQIRLKKLGLVEEYDPGRFRNVRANRRLTIQLATDAAYGGGCES